MKKIVTIEDAKQAFEQYYKLDGDIFCYIAEFHNKHKYDIIGSEFGKLDDMKRKGIFTNIEVIKQKLEIIEIYSLDR